MNYTDITELALEETDRTDADTLSNIDRFLRLVEARVNRRLRTMNMSADTDLPVVPGTTLYALPSGFRGARLLKWVDGDSVTPMKLVTPEQYAEESDSIYGAVSDPTNRREIHYFIDDGFIYLWQAQQTGSINLLYYVKVPELSSGSPTNWLGDDYADVYVNGLCKEIEVFNKNKEAAMAWDDMFKVSLAEIKVEDKHDRWSGAPMQMRTP